MVSSCLTNSDKMNSPKQLEKQRNSSVLTIQLAYFLYVGFSSLTIAFRNHLDCSYIQVRLDRKFRISQKNWIIDICLVVRSLRSCDNTLIQSPTDRSTLRKQTRPKFWLSENTVILQLFGTLHLHFGTPLRQQSSHHIFNINNFMILNVASDCY
jgi:hypothetical protein